MALFYIFWAWALVAFVGWMDGSERKGCESCCESEGAS